MRTYEATVERPGLPRARYRVAFHDHKPLAISVTYLRAGQQARPLAISTPTARAAIAAALPQAVTPPKPRDRADPTAPYAALAQMARVSREKEPA